MTPNILTAAPALALGAAAMYYFDPEQGAERRAQAADKLASFVGAVSTVGGTQMQELAIRAQGWWSEAKSAFESRDDEHLAAPFKSSRVPRLHGKSKRTRAR